MRVIALLGFVALCFCAEVEKPGKQILDIT
jgi:hypothetical protein